jgi:hypothetical protein
MSPLILAQVLAGGGIASWAVWIIIVAAIVAIVVVICRQMGVAIPPFVVTILWIILAAVIGVLAIKFLLSVV